MSGVCVNGVHLRNRLKAVANRLAAAEQQVRPTAKLRADLAEAKAEIEKHDAWCDRGCKK